MVILDQESIGLITYFEKKTGARIKDCFYEAETLVFVVEPGQLRRALGKNAENVKRFSERIRKRVKLIEFSPEPERFLRNLLYPLRPEIGKEGEKIILKAADNKEKGKIYGRERSNLARLQKLMDKYFSVTIEVQ